MPSCKTVQGETNNGHIVNLSVRKPYLVVDMVLGFRVAPCSQAGRGGFVWVGLWWWGEEGERERCG